jgi:hypothetical protein
MIADNNEWIVNNDEWESWRLLNIITNISILGGVYGERLACLGGRIFTPLIFSLLIIHDSFMIIHNHGRINMNVEVFRNIFYSYLQ